MESWLRENASWILTVAGVFGYAIKNEVTTNRLKDTVYARDSGDLRLVRVSDCNTCRVQCQESVLQENIKIHKKLDLLINLHLKEESQ